MIIKKIKLNNIRSYLDKEIILSEGRTLLSGDIGSGKSTILLALDFALFGLQKGNLSGNSLLRNGKKEGYVEMHFDIENKSYALRRTLKRGTAVSQESGYIIEDNVKRDLSPIEIKQAVLDILNYPRDLLTKTKSLIYRYTVYTPQEEMKYILAEDKDLRLDILRKLFGIDKYKKVKDNVKIFNSRLREKVREYSGYIIDIDEKLKHKDELEKSTITLNTSLISLNQGLSLINNDIEDKNKEIKLLENQNKELANLKKEFEIIHLNIDHKISLRNENKSRIEYLDDYVKTLKKELKDVEEVSKEELQSKENEIKFMESTINSIRYNVNETEIKIKNSKLIKANIIKLDICPVCKQNVSKDHINHMNENEDSAIKENEELINLHRENLKEAENKLNNLKKENEELKTSRHEFELNKMKIKNLEEKEKELARLNEANEKLKEEVGIINAKKSAVSESIKTFKDIEDKYNKEREILNSLLAKQRVIEINIASSRREIDDKEKELLNLMKEIERKNIARENLDKLNKLKFWLENEFVLLIDAIEKNVMLRIYNDFNSLFQKWSDMLIDNENMRIRLSEEFSPIIEQNGYDIEYEFLSGGEKTAMALAYRLALNQIINNLISDIKTKDLLILDEPTDGFSDEQLDKVRLVLDELKIRQIILVSHEVKIENFVDRIIRLEKKNHVTEII